MRRALCLYALKYGCSSKLIPSEVQIVVERFQMDCVYLKNMIKAFQRQVSAKFPSFYEEIRAEKSNKLFQSFRGVQNVNSQHQLLFKMPLTSYFGRLLSKSDYGWDKWVLKKRCVVYCNL